MSSAWDMRCDMTLQDDRDWLQSKSVGHSHLSETWKSWMRKQEPQMVSKHIISMFWILEVTPLDIHLALPASTYCTVCPNGNSVHACNSNSQQQLVPLYFPSVITHSHYPEFGDPLRTAGHWIIDEGKDESIGIHCSDAEVLRNWDSSHLTITQDWIDWHKPLGSQGR